MIASIFVLWKKLCDVNDSLCTFSEQTGNCFSADSRGMFELLYDLFFNEDFNILTWFSILNLISWVKIELLSKIRDKRFL